MNFKLSQLSSAFKWALSAYLFLISLGFGIASLQSYDRYQWDHQKTIEHYLGSPDEGDPIPKPYGYLLSVTHVHSFTMPLVFLSVWILLQGTSVSSAFKKICIIVGMLSILLYNASPYLVRYESPKLVSAFTIGGIGLFVSFFIPALLAFYEMWIGFRRD